MSYYRATIRQGVPVVTEDHIAVWEGRSLDDCVRYAAALNRATGARREELPPLDEDDLEAPEGGEAA